MHPKNTHTIHTININLSQQAARPTDKGWMSRVYVPYIVPQEQQLFMYIERRSSA